MFRRDGAEVHLEPQVFDLLVLLGRHAGQLVTKDTLVEEVWRGLAVSDATINARISAARAAVGDDGKAQRVIRTIPRRGFILQAEVSGADTVARSEEMQTGEPLDIRYALSRDSSAIAWTSNGDGPPLVRISHWLSHLEIDWQGQIWRPTIERLSRTNRVIRYDLRGTGLSSRDAPLEGIDGFVDDLEAVMDAAGVAQANLFAASQAAPVAIAFAARFPERVGKLVIVGGYAEGRVFRPPHAEMVDEPTILSMIRLGWGKPGSPFMQALSTLFLPDGTPEQMAEMVHMQLATADPETAVTMRKVIDRFQVRDDLPKVRAPTLVFHAQDDAIHPITQGQRIAAGIPGARFVRLEGRNHMLLPQDPAWGQVMDMTDRFLHG
ncbi:alpha/beta fold hydrolase [Aestuariicoccus sp. MJ-SS9]|uniref:alpha/beta fold hydrolase n=1 Tax=Aestuariicoccus sp. MJ-SS9 TaxID=3079855 RepID=UPI0029071B2A|nr:alpha/beta fold hydrolase [Aestuariicoccus sp. MJ-SS9]MDU8911537.1 alpha/beta fold hydrolase [Aestuariicoccus sp. MJ-SS9]